ncbi:MAG: DUF6446 family protein [Paracoccaceae bacterium]
MLTRIILGGIVLFAIVAGALLYYLQVYAYYEEISADVANVQLVNLVTDQAEPVMFENYQGIDSDSSPLRYRACFELPMSLAALTETYVISDEAEPRVAPGWFDCFDASAIGADLASGTAVAFLGERDVTYGVDRIVAVYPDGRAMAWHQINACGEVVFDGNPVPEGCPPPPE